MGGPKAYLRRQSQPWYVQIAGKQINLRREKNAAKRRYHEQMAKGWPFADDAAANQPNSYLAHGESNLSPATFQENTTLWAASACS